MFEKISNKRAYSHVTVHVPHRLMTASDTICIAPSIIDTGVVGLCE